MKLILFLLRYFRGYLGLVAVGTLAALLYGLSTAAVIALIEPVFEEVLLAKNESIPAALGVAAGGTAGGQEAAAPAIGRTSIFNLKALLDRGYEALKDRFGVTQSNVIFFVPLLTLAVFLFRSVMSFFSAYSFQRIGLAITNDIRNDLYRNILGQSSSFHAEYPSGELMSRVVNDVGVMQIAVSYRAVDLVQQSLTLVFLAALLLSTNLRLAAICLVAMPAFIYPIFRFGRGMRRTSHRSQERMADIASLMGEGVRGHRVVKAFGMEQFEYDRFREATGRHLKVNLRAQMLATLSSPVVESVGVTLAIALIIYAGFEIRAGAFSAPLFLAFMTNLFWMYEPLRKLNRVNLVLQQSMAAVQRVWGLMQVPNEITEGENPRTLATVEKGVAFEGVRFAYADEPVLHGIDLEIAKGEEVALVGPSGAGKSTLINLLPRFFDPVEGRVTIDGIDVRELSLESLRALIGLVTQGTILFDDTIRNNIGYGRRDLPLEMIRESAAAAYADEFIMALPEAYDTRIGEAGVKLSGGQRQRLAIARALVKNAPILILDEATSELDSESEALVQKAIANLTRGRTTLVIAHRLSTVVEANRIVVLEAGRIVEQGTHEALLASGGIYKRLYDLQFQA